MEYHGVLEEMNLKYDEQHLRSRDVAFIWFEERPMKPLHLRRVRIEMKDGREIVRHYIRREFPNFYYRLAVGAIPGPYII
jgi:hypothetical protein